MTKSVLPIFLYGCDILRQKAQAVTALDNATIKLMYDMMETMHRASGIGLAANQVGHLKRIIVVDVTSAEEEGEEHGNGSEPNSDNAVQKKFVIMNPEVIEKTGSWQMEEGCLSIPDVRGDVERAERIKVRFRNANFDEEILEADGLLARVILHEIDHLDGVLFVDHLNSAKRSLLMPKLRKIKKGETDASYPVVIPESARKSKKANKLEV